MHPAIPASHYNHVPPSYQSSSSKCDLLCSPRRPAFDFLSGLYHLRFYFLLRCLHHHDFTLSTTPFDICTTTPSESSHPPWQTLSSRMCSLSPPNSFHPRTTTAPQLPHAADQPSQAGRAATTLLDIRLSPTATSTRSVSAYLTSTLLCLPTYSNVAVPPEARPHTAVTKVSTPLLFSNVHLVADRACSVQPPLDHSSTCPSISLRCRTTQHLAGLRRRGWRWSLGGIVLRLGRVD